MLSLSAGELSKEVVVGGLATVIDSFKSESVIDPNMVCLFFPIKVKLVIRQLWNPHRLLVWETMHRLEKAGLVFPVPAITPSFGYWPI